MNKEQGKKNKRTGAEFERKVRADLEDRGWTVSKWRNNVDNFKIVPCKSKWNNFTHSLMMDSGGFPDFIAFKKKRIPLPSPVEQTQNGELIVKPVYRFIDTWEILGVECKVRGYLDKEEKIKTEWMIKEKIFSNFIIAKKDENGKIAYTEAKL